MLTYADVSIRQHTSAYVDEGRTKERQFMLIYADV
jgi:hypothetical protein